MKAMNNMAQFASAVAERNQIEAPGELAQALTEVFARALGISSVFPESDFFELGGDSISATALALEIEEICQIPVPATLLFDAPTPVALAQLLEQRAAPQAGPLVLLKKGNKEPPVFLIPGLAGSPMEIARLAGRVAIPNPIYGLQLPGRDARELSLRRIEEMGAYFLPAIRARQPHGPYLLGGYSMGGLTAVELARALRGAGETVALLALFDTALQRKKLSLGQRFAVWRRRLEHHAAAARGQSIRYTASYIRRRRLRRPSEAEPHQVHQSAVVQRGLENVIAGATAAIHAYRPRYYPGTITFFAAIDDADWPVYPEITWRPLAETLEVHRIDGTHLGLLRADVAATAEEFAAAVNSALEAT